MIEVVALTQVDAFWRWLCDRGGCMLQVVI